MHRPAPFAWLVLALSWMFAGSPESRAVAAELRPPGFRPAPPGVHALVGGRVVVRPGEILEAGTIVIRDGLIQDVGRSISPPSDARVWDLKGATVYAGFIDPYLALTGTNSPVSTTDVEPVSSGSATAGVNFFGVQGAAEEPTKAGPGYAVAKITPEYRAVRSYAPKDKDLAPWRELGFTAGVVVPTKGILRGTSALVALTDGDPNQAILKPDLFQHIAFDTYQADDRAYPASLMGVIAVIRQSFFDAQHFALDTADYQRHPAGRKRPEYDPALAALAPAIARQMRVIFEPGSALMVDRAARLATELGLDLAIVACGQEWRRPDLAQATGATFIVPLNFPSLPKLPEETDWSQVTLDQLRAWDWAPENPAVLRRQGRDVALTCFGLTDKAKFRTNLRQALDRGLTESDALAALTTVPARLCGAEPWLGTVEAGKLAYLTVVDGTNYFDPKAKVREVWIDGRVFPIPAEEPKPESAEMPRADQTSSNSVDQASAAKAASTNAVVAKKSADKDDKAAQLRQAERRRIARSPLDGRGPLASPSTVLVEGATIWTCGPAGRLESADLWVQGGKIRQVGPNLRQQLETNASTLVIDGHGLHLTPGLIDCHSHTAILGDVNEGTIPSSAMVRIVDVVNSEAATLYQQLAGGVTLVNLLHGSANPIGGQNCIIKLRDGAGPAGLVFEPAPPGIKFALGENVKQSNWGEKFVTRFPQTRMGVRTFIANRFTAARQYLAEWETYRQRKAATGPGEAAPVPPRRDLELETIGEILQGKRWIHCHSYRQDEILMLIRLMEQFDVKVGTFQHVLEGYKVADEIARHGAGGSTFSDWWAYKFEVYDAIPYNGSLMRDRGVLVSFNSDSSELARHLYLEAAKAVKYGGTPEIEALQFVTLNPAKQLRIDPFVGSLEPGKDADFVLWSKSPLDSGTVCLQTWIEGKKYFDRLREAGRAAELEKERADLLAKARQVAKLAGGDSDSAGPKESAAAARFFRVSLEHAGDACDRSCRGEE